MKKQLLVLGLLFSSASVQAAHMALGATASAAAGALYYWFIENVAMNVVGGPTAAANAAAKAANATAAAANATAAAATDAATAATNAIRNSLPTIDTAANSIPTMIDYVKAVQTSVSTWVADNPTTTKVAAGAIAAATAYGLYRYFSNAAPAELTEAALDKLIADGNSICRFNVTRNGVDEEAILLNGTQIKGPEIIGGNTDIKFRPSRNYQQTRADQVCNMVLPQRGNLSPVTLVVKDRKATQVSGITIQTKDITYVPIGR